jgi:hypothetical protein
MSAHRPSLVFLPAMLAIAAVPAAAADLQRDCRAVRALVNGDGRHFADFDFDAHPRLSVPVRLDRRRVAIVDDERCDAEPGDDTASMECTWTFSDYRAAAGFYDALVDRLRTCLGQPVLPPEPDPDDETPQVTVPRDLRQHHADIVLAGWESEFELKLSEDPQDATPDGRRPASVRYEVVLYVESGILVEEEEESDATPPSAAID